jgi:hypothetical protein
MMTSTKMSHILLECGSLVSILFLLLVFFAVSCLGICYGAGREGEERGCETDAYFVDGGPSNPHFNPTPFSRCK